MKNRKKQLLIECLLYAILFSFVSIILTIALKLWEKDLKIPFSYMIDAFGPLREVKNITLGNGLYDIPQVAAPLGGDETRAIKGFIVHYFLLKVFAAFTENAPLSVNLYYLLSYPLTACLSFFAMKRIGLKKSSAFILSVLYSFLPYHFYKSTYHLFLSCYYLIPLACLVIFKTAVTDIRIRNNWFSKTSIFMIVISLLIGLSDTYYAAFYCIILAFSALHGSICKKSLESVITGVLLCFVTLVSALAAIFPMIYTSIVYGGKNVYSGLRGIYDVELYSVKLAQLILPIHGHRINWLNMIRTNYESASVPAHEGANAALGIIMGTGFILSIVYLFTFRKTVSKKALAISRIVLFIFLSCSIGGIDTFIGLFITTSIRSYARMTVFLAFFSACFWGMCFDAVVKRKSTVVRYVVSILILILGLLDQISPLFSKLGYYEAFTNGIYLPYDEIVEIYQDDALFVQEIEKNMPEQAMILELPLVFDTVGDCFPNGATGAMGLVRPYLHSHSTVWSCASQRGDENDRWLGKLSQFSNEEMLDIAIAAGFQGIYIDTTGYTETELTKLIETIEQKTNATAISNRNGDLLFYNLVEYSKHIKSFFSSDEFANYSEAVLKLHQLENEWIYYPETNGISLTKNCYKDDSNFVIPPGEMQFGPYQEFETGSYQIYILGDNLSKTEISVYNYNSGDPIFFPIQIAYQDTNGLSYEFELNANTPNVEFTLKNIGDENCILKHIFLVKKNSENDDLYIIDKLQELLLQTQNTSL